MTSLTSIILLGFLGIPAAEPNEVTHFHSDITWPFFTAPTHNPLLCKASLLICRTDENNSKTKTNSPSLEYQELSPLPIYQCIVLPSISLKPSFQQAVWSPSATFGVYKRGRGNNNSRTKLIRWRNNLVLKYFVRSLINKHLNFKLIQ